MFQTTQYPVNTSNSQNTDMIIEQSLSQVQNKQEDSKRCKSIIELQKEINYYKSKERLYKIQLIEKQETIKALKELKSYYENIKKNHKEIPPEIFRKDQIFAPKTQKLIYALKKIIEDKNSILASLEEELYSSNEQCTKFFTVQLGLLHKDNIDIYKYIQGNNIENFKKENNNEKNQLNALLVKIAECQENINDLIKSLEEINDTSSVIKRKFDDKK